MVLRVFRHFVPVSIICLAMSDLLLVFLALRLIFVDDQFPSLRLADALSSPSLKLSLMIGLGAVISGLYDTKSFLTYRSLVTQILLSLFFTIVILAVGGLTFVNWAAPLDWFWELQKAALTWLVCVLLTRAVFITIADLEAFKRRIVVLGNGEMAERIGALAANRRARFVPIHYLDEKKLAEEVKRDSPPDSPAMSTIHRFARDLEVSEIVIATDGRGLPLDDLMLCRRAGIKITPYVDFIERETNSIDVNAVQPGWFLFADGFKNTSWRKFWKRTTDVVLSLFLLLATLPLMLFTCVLIALESSGPVLLRQERIGLGGHPFVLLKFRSMFADAEEDGVARWASRGDARITTVGKFIRKFRIDELPQLINVLRGDMSFVGPRPERPVFVSELTEKIPFYPERHWVKPGITGWAQIQYQYGASVDDARIKLSYDLYYVKNHGLFLDLLIVLQTVRVILWADGAR
jgi:sugar transferase (PEP-CTERM system associated)